MLPRNAIGEAGSGWRGRALIAAGLAWLAFNAGAQVRLDEVFDRGYVSEWLVCGPFAPDAEGGIREALARGAAPLGTTDFMAPLGGLARVVPKEGLEVAAGGAPIAWRKLSAQSRCIHLASLFGELEEGVVFAAFAASAQTERLAYFDVQSPLGVRAYLNGAEVYGIRAAPFDGCGVSRFLGAFRPGVNWMIIEAPLADFDVIAQAYGREVETIRASGFPGRPLLEGMSPFELGLRLLPAEKFGGVAYIPVLDSAGTSSEAGGALRLDAWLTLFNYSSSASPAFTVQTAISSASKPVRQVVSPIPAESEAQALLGIPVSGMTLEEVRTVEVTLQHDAERVKFTATLKGASAAVGGTVYVVTGQRQWHARAPSQSADVSEQRAAFDRNLVVLENDPKYGFDLGASGLWKPLLETHPEARKPLLEAVAALRCGTHAGYESLDERIVGGETLVRNLAYGVRTGQALLEASRPSYYAWDAPAVCAQLPQLLEAADVPGLVSNLAQGGLPPLFWQEALDGTRILHRHKRSQPGPASTAALRDAAALQRQELVKQGFAADLLVLDSVTPPPDPFYLGACAALARAVPSIVVSGAGASRFFESAHDSASSAPGAIPVLARALYFDELGAVAAQPALKHAYGEVENLVGSAEKLATFAGLFGAVYPEADLDVAWRQLLYTGTPSRVGFAPGQRDYADALGALHEAAFFARGVLDRSAAYLAGQTDTFSGAPGDTKTLMALVVFNPSSWIRTDVCCAELRFDPGAPGLTLLDKTGEAVSFIAEDVERVNERIVRARISFVAREIPALGVATYYVRSQGDLPRPNTGAGAAIENDRLRVLADPLTGAILEFGPKGAKEKYNRGPLDAVIALAEDAAKTHGGRDCWTLNDAPLRVTGPAELRVEKFDWMQRLTIRAPFAEGQVVRKLTLYDGVAKLYCQTRFVGVRSADRLVAATFDMDGTNRVPVFGERFGALAGRKSRGVLDFRTDGAANPSGTGLRPALHWAALTPNDHIKAGRGVVVPLQPCAIVCGLDARLMEAAHHVQTALAGRGIPAAVCEDAAPRLSLTWTDSTEYPDFDRDLDDGTAMRIVIGNQEQNIFCRHLSLRMKDDVLQRFNARMETGATLFLLDDRVPEGYPPVPTLILAGQTEGGTAAQAIALGNAIAATGVFAMAPEDYLPESGNPQPETGLAILCKGAFLASVERDGTFALVFSQGSRWTDAGGGEADAAGAESCVFDYALYPFAGTWRDAGVVRAAHAWNEPLVAALTATHLGVIPREQSFFAPEHLGFVVTAVKPARYAAAGMERRTPNPRESFVVRGYESLGSAWHAGMTFFAPIAGAMRANLLDEKGDALVTEGNRIAHAIGADVIETMIIEPGPIGRGQNSGVSLESPSDPSGVVLTRYWTQNRGAAPRYYQPLGVLLRGRLAEGDAAAEAVVTNNTSDETIAGTVEISASDEWSVSPARFDYALEPGEYHLEKIAVLRSAGRATSGGIAARAVYANQTYLDVLDIDTTPLSLTATRSGREIRIEVTNRSALAAEGYLEVVGPPAYWTECAPVQFPTLASPRVAVNVPPFRDQETLFLLSSAEADGPFTAKLAANGHVVYADVPASPASR